MTQSNTGKCFPTYFSLHYQTSKNTFLEFTFPGIYFPKENYFPANKRDLGRKHGEKPHIYHREKTME